MILTFCIVHGLRHCDPAWGSGPKWRWKEATSGNERKERGRRETDRPRESLCVQEKERARGREEERRLRWRNAEPRWLAQETRSDRKVGKKSREKEAEEYHRLKSRCEIL